MIAIVLSILFGLGWGIGLLATEKISSTSIRDMFASLFIIITSFHGLFVFILHCARSKDSRDEWLKWFFKATKRDLSDLTSSVFDHFHHHRNANSSQPSVKTTTSKATKMIDLPPSFASLSYSTTSSLDTVKIVSVNDRELGNVVDHETTRELDGCEKAMEAEMETELTKVDLAEVKAQQAPASMLDSDATSSNQGTQIFHEDPVAVKVHVTDDGNSDPEDKFPFTQRKSLTAVEKMKSYPLQSASSDREQTPEDREMEKMEELCQHSLGEVEKDAGKDAEQPKEDIDEDEKQQPEEIGSQ